MAPSRQSLSAYHRNWIDETGDGGSYADRGESDFSISDVHCNSFIGCCLRNGLPGAFPWFDQMFAAGRLEQVGPYGGPDWGFFFVTFKNLFFHEKYSVLIFGIMKVTALPSTECL